MKAVSKLQSHHHCLSEFVCMTKHNVNIKSQLRFGASKTGFAMA